MFKTLKSTATFKCFESAIILISLRINKIKESWNRTNITIFYSPRTSFLIKFKEFDTPNLRKPICAFKYQREGLFPIN